MDYEKLRRGELSETSETILKRVQAARDIQIKRFVNGVLKDVVCNADMRIGEVRRLLVAG
jgi:predicted ATPase with chaperone activity